MLTSALLLFLQWSPHNRNTFTMKTQTGLVLSFHGIKEDMPYLN